MGKIKLNLRKRDESAFETFIKYKNQGGYRLTKQLIRKASKKIGIKTARDLVKNFKSCGICPVVTRLNFSWVEITY